jgi:glyoxylase-like metal-dependent hydrolase (beta-lactamase superfamily II)
LAGRPLEIVATPGHTPDGVSLFDREHGPLFTGDTYYPGAIWLYRPETNLEAYGVSVNSAGVEGFYGLRILYIRAGV